MLTKELLFRLKIQKPDVTYYEQCKKAWDGLSKPLDGFGDFEDLICTLAAIEGTYFPRVENRAAVIFCADNGIVEEGVSQCGQDVTFAVAKALGSGISTANTLGKSAKVDVIPVDVGIASSEDIYGIKYAKINNGTRNFLKEPAMVSAEVCLAIETGMNLVKELKGRGYDILATGEMGIGNTTTSAAVLSAILRIDSDEITGRGAGLDDEGLLRKKAVIREGISKYDFDSISDEKERAFNILMCLGGLDIAALCGLIIGCGIYHVPVVLDGIISSTAAVVAEKLVQGAANFCIASHRGREVGNMLALKALGLKPYIDGDMALGEGTGAIMLFPLIDLANDYFVKGAKFSDYSIDEYKRFS
ncbi:nicotinate-nucleotide--dimethylbenzimidazole phosphoribosyltransferase [Butyrivibrio sp. NC2002]|uniref:nicotinate-nucleotide--dimethylbenzimidazole phosphoribosyltransferase n=1 Tax=Butyrivibrio sp. NC2002 TaxID=1410610 RepID=UPI00055B446D|nr:nicotinate-nucleotide--dimethylbenzimidazole phosphoribosyltransferase [Butyrivibrio sp. NC2002]